MVYEAMDSFLMKNFLIVITGQARLKVLLLFDTAFSER